MQNKKYFLQQKCLWNSISNKIKPLLYSYIQLVNITRRVFSYSLQIGISETIRDRQIDKQLQF